MEDFIRVMDENPSWLEAARSRVLTRELMEFPEKFAEYAEASDREFQAIRERFTLLNSRQDLFDLRMDRMDFDSSILRIWEIRRITRERGAIIAADFDCKRVKTLSDVDLIAMSRAADTGGIPANDLRSFRRADLVTETVRYDTGETRYIAVAISYAVNGRTTSRAIRNAGFLRRFTGKDALAVVAGFRKDNRVDEDIAANGVAWYKLDEEFLGR